VPKYSYVCGCGHSFDELHLSFGSAERAEAEGIKCPKCGSTKTTRDTMASMKGGGFRRYGLWTYDGKGNM
jgi:DNA-directed RNA polymerase subunit RPC12/RpoP